MTQNKLVAFCYLFIIGICICMAFPASPAAVSPLWYLAAALLAASAAGLWYLRRARPPVEDTSIYDAPFRFDGLQVAIWALVLVTGLVLGYARYLSMIQSPDTYLGTVTIASDASSAPLSAIMRMSPPAQNPRSPAWSISTDFTASSARQAFTIARSAKMPRSRM